GRGRLRRVRSVPAAGEELLPVGRVRGSIRHPLCGGGRPAPDRTPGSGGGGHRVAHRPDPVAVAQAGGGVGTRWGARLRGGVAWENGPRDGFGGRGCGMTPVERLLVKFPGAKTSGNGWSVRCPAHRDRHASLSIAEGDDGRALVKCHAGCTAEV